MTAKIFCMASAKGGSGKTVLTATFASFLTAIGKKCLIVDCDAATHGLTLLYLHNVNKKIQNSGSSRLTGTLDCEPIDVSNDAIKVENGVDLIPATYRFELYECIDGTAFFNSISALLLQVKSEYDYIFLDSQAGSDPISHTAMKKGISDEVIIVSEYDPLSAAGVERLKSIFNYDLEFTRTWVLLNKMLPEFVEKFSDFLSVTRYLSPIPWTSDVVRSYSRRKLALDTEYGNEYTLAIMQTLKSLLGEELEVEINNWAEEKAYNIRQPLETQYLDAENEFITLIEAKKSLGKFSFNIFIYKFISILVIVGTVPILSTFMHFYNKGVRGYTSVGIIVSVLLIILGFLSYLLVQKVVLTSKTSEDEIKEARYDRQLEIVRERLKKLEALKKADLKTLIKTTNQ